MPDSKPKFVIGGQEYPMATTFRLVDPVLVREATGMAWADFVEALDDESRRADPTVLLGLLAVAVWQAHPRWTRDRVLRFLEDVEITSVTFHGGEADNPPGVPGDGPAEAPSTTSAADANGSPDSSSAPTPPSSGTPPSVTSSQVSIPG